MLVDRLGYREQVTLNKVMQRVAVGVCQHSCRVPTGALHTPPWIALMFSMNRHQHPKTKHEGYQ